MAGLTVMGVATLGASGVAGAATTAHASAVHVRTVHAGAVHAKTGGSGTTIDPLQYGCQVDAPSCGNNGANRGGIGESYADYNGQAVDILYSENWYCDANVSSNASTGCEAGAGLSPTPSNPSSGGTGTSLGNTTSADTLYIPVPLFQGAPATQCPAGSATVVCIDHPKNIDLSRLAPVLDPILGTTPTQLNSVPIPAHNHVIATTNSNKPEWWNVEVVATTDPATFNGLTSVSAINTAVSGGKAVTAPTNVDLFFQVLPGTVPASVATNPANLNAMDAPPGSGYSASPAPTAGNQAETGSTFNNLKVDCGADGPNCQGIGIAHGYVAGTPGTSGGQDVQLLYTENYFCGTPTGGNTPASASGCEAGSAGAVPPGVSDTTIADAANSAPGATGGNTQIDPLYIPVPLGFTPKYSQCPTAITCIDHPMDIDLSNLAPYLPGNPPASALHSVPLPSHDHVLRTRNADAPEWWNVEVVPVTSQAQLDAIEAGKNLTTAQESPFNPSTNGGGSIDTNVYLWFQTLPGQAVATPGPGAVASAATPTPGTCANALPSGTVVAGANLPDGTGYVQTDAKGDVFVAGAATCYGSLSGIALNKPIVGIAVDRTTGGYWLVASDGGVFSFNAPYLGSLGDVRLNQPIVGIATDLNSKGYDLVASDGGVFTFNETFSGSTGNIHLNKPVVGMAFDPAGGYYLVASDGGVFTFGGATYYGSTGNVTLNKPIVAIDPVLDGTGYRLVASDGGTFQFNVPFLGSLGNVHLNQPIVAASGDNSSDGFNAFAADGGVFTFDTYFYGSAAG